MLQCSMQYSHCILSTCRYPCQRACPVNQWQSMVLIITGICQCSCCLQKIFTRGARAWTSWTGQIGRFIAVANYGQPGQTEVMSQIFILRTGNAYLEEVSPSPLLLSFLVFLSFYVNKLRASGLSFHSFALSVWMCFLCFYSLSVYTFLFMACFLHTWNLAFLSQNAPLTNTFV